MSQQNITMPMICHMLESGEYYTKYMTVNRAMLQLDRDNEL